MTSKADGQRQVIATNRRARFEYEISDRFEAGIVLVGPEVKSLRAGKANLTDAYAYVKRGEMWLSGMHISPYEKASRDNPDPTRDRKLLLHRKEIDRLAGRVQEKGFTLVPLQLYFKEGRVKVEIGLARGKRMHDKRESIKARESDRELLRMKRRGGRYRE
jgi:SsrA-binding protein